MAAMYLANLWFGHRAVTLPSQLQQAANWGFRGVAMLSGGVSREADQGLEPTHTESAELAVVSVDQLLAAREPSMEEFRWRESDVELLLKRLKRLRCAQLLVPTGVDARPNVEQRGAELLVRVRGGEQIEARTEGLAFFDALASLGWEQQLQHLAAFLYELRRRAPGLKVAVAPEPSPAGLLNPGRLKLLLEDVGNFGIGYWHDAGVMETRFMATGEAPGEWLDSFSNIMQGSTLHDFSGGSEHLPPGLGQVDWQLLREYLPREAIRVLAVAPSYPGEILAECRSELESRLQP